MPLDVLNEDSILELAKATLLEINCDAAAMYDCFAVLASIDAYRMHLIDHYQANKKPGTSTEHQCFGVTTGGRFCRDLKFPTLEELHEHIDTAHIKNMKTWPCPFTSCTPLNFKSPPSLQEHFRVAHSAYNGYPIVQLHPLLRPSWRPTSDSNTLHPPPPIPEPSHQLLSELIAPVTLPRMKPSQTPKTRSTPLPSQYSTILSPARKISRLESIESMQSRQSIEQDIELDDLSHPSNEKLGNAAIVIWRRPKLLVRDTARPIPTSAEKRTSFFNPPASIHYEVFKMRVERLRQDSILDPYHS
ncbi:hypothetical protein L218DRAFT_705325 [Marasmius fiardii PR-910]|nr:hypothetical protein L218DRAFT_705325 [Marasmius fiardii PR-910]